MIRFPLPRTARGPEDLAAMELEETFLVIAERTDIRRTIRVDAELDQALLVGELGDEQLSRSELEACRHGLM